MIEITEDVMSYFVLGLMASIGFNVYFLVSKIDEKKIKKLFTK